MNNKLTIKGVAVSEGVSRNKRRYLGNELEKFAPTLNNRPILKDHEGATDNVIGKITSSIYDPTTKSVKYSGWVKEDGTGIIEKIRDGRISEVSIGAIAKKVVKENKEDDIIIPLDLEAMELSTTPVPGNKGTSINFESKKYSSDDLNEMINNYEQEAQITGMEGERKRRGMSVSQFYAAPRNPPSSSALPIFDASHTRNAMARFNQTKFTSNSEKTKAKAAIMKAAKRFKIDITNFETFNTLYNIEKEDKSMEQTTENSEVSEKQLTEISELKKQLEALSSKNAELEKEKADYLEAQRQEAISKYKSLCESKKVEAKDLTNANMEMITFALEMVDSLPEEEEKPVEDSKEEEKPAEETPKEEENVKPVAKAKSKAIVSEDLKEDSENYVITTEDVSGPGVALYKKY